MDLAYNLTIREQIVMRMLGPLWKQRKDDAPVRERSESHE